MILKSNKTIFITVARGFITKSILRSDVLDELKKSGSRIIILFWSVYGQPLPEELRQEFESEQVKVEAVPSLPESRFYRHWRKLTSRLVYNSHNRRFRYLANNRYLLFFYFEHLLLWIISRLHWLKTLARWLEITFFTQSNYATYFDRYQPDLVFATSIISSFDLAFLKLAKKRGLMTVGMPRGWDNINSHFYSVVPDRLVVHNEIMRRDAIKRQKFEAEKVVVTGFAQFDWYRRPEILKSRADFFRVRGLDPAKRLILWGSTGKLTQQKTSICDTLVRAVQMPDQLSLSAQLLIRAHFSDAKTNRFNYLIGQQAVTIDDNIKLSDFFYDAVNPTREEIINLANTIYHSDLVIVQSSTLTLDALCFDKPVINTAFQGLYDRQGRDITAILYDEDCYRPLVDLGAIDVVYNESELLASISSYLSNPSRHRAQRLKALAQLAYRVDGQASRRIAETILSLI